MRKLARQLVVGDICLSGETIVGIRKCGLYSRKLEIALEDKNRKIRTASWGINSTIFLKTIEHGENQEV